MAGCSLVINRIKSNLNSKERGQMRKHWTSLNGTALKPHLTLDLEGLPWIIVSQLRFPEAKNCDAAAPVCENACPPNLCTSLSKQHTCIHLSDFIASMHKQSSRPCKAIIILGFEIDWITGDVPAVPSHIFKPRISLFVLNPSSSRSALPLETERTYGCHLFGVTCFDLRAVCSKLAWN